MLAVVDGLTTIPALVLSPYFEVPAFNALADEIFCFGEHDAPYAGSHAWRLFMNLKRQGIYGQNLDAAMDRTVGILRAHYATRIGDSQFEDLLDTLRTGSEQFMRMWDEQRTAGFEEIDAWTLHTRLGRVSVAALRFFLQRARLHHEYPVPDRWQDDGSVLGIFSTKSQGACTCVRWRIKRHDEWRSIRQHLAIASSIIDGAAVPLAR